MNLVKLTIQSLLITSCSHLWKVAFSFKVQSSNGRPKLLARAQSMNEKEKLILKQNIPLPSLLISRRKTISSISFLLGLQQLNLNNPSNAAPPFAIIAEELGYFPVTNRANQTMYVPSRVKRPSSDQAIEFAEYLSSKNTVMYGAFWCPHCQNQKEILGREAFSKIKYVECDSRGYNSNNAICLKDNISGFPTWKIGKKTISGELSLQDLAKVSGYKGVIDLSLEKDLPSLRDGACK